MNVIDVVLPELHAAQRYIKANARRFNVGACGRRFGKTTFALDLVADVTLPEDGPGLPVGWFAPKGKLFAEAWREAVRLFTPVAERVSVAEHRIDFITGGSLEMWSLHNDPDAGRGNKYRRVIYDEAGQTRHLESSWNDAVRATLIDLQGDAWFFGTPKGRNFFHTLHERGKRDAKGPWASFHLPTMANPYMTAAEIEAMRREHTERSFRQEVLAEFLVDGGGVFRQVTAACTAEKLATAYAGTFVMGVDWGRSNDYTVAVVMDAQKRKAVDWDRFSEIGYSLQRDRVKALVDKWGVTAVLAESNSIGQPNIEALQADGVPVAPFYTSNETKAVVIEALSLAIEQGMIEAPEDDVFEAELAAYELATLPSGRPKYGAPPGKHDDCVIALALAYAAASGGTFEAF